MFVFFMLTVLFQEPNPIRVNQPKISIEFKLDGKSELRNNALIVGAPMFPEMPILKSKSLVKEIELSAAQKTSVAGLLDKTYRKQNEFWREHPEFTSEGYSRYLRNKYWAIGGELRSELIEILLPHQETCIKELAARIRLKERGFLRFLDELDKNKTLRISPSEKRFAVATCRKLSDSHEIKIEEIRKEFFQTAVKPLKKDQVDELLKVQGAQILNDFVIAELNHILSESYKSELPPEDLIDLCRYSTALVWLNIEGSWQREKHDRQVTGAVLSLTDWLIGNAKLVKLTPEQITELENVEVEVDDSLTQIRNDFAKARKLNWDVAIDSKNKTIDELQRRIQAKVIDEVLTTKQKNAIKKTLLQSRQLRFGPVVSLLEGTYDKHLSISKHQKGELRKSVKKARDELEKNLSDLEESNMTEFINSLEGPNRARLNNVLGERPKYLYPSIKLMFENLKIPPGF